MPRDITSPRNAKIGYVVLLAVIRYTHGDAPWSRQGSPLQGYCHQTLEGAKLNARSFKKYGPRMYHVQRMPTLRNRSVNLISMSCVRGVSTQIQRMLTTFSFKNPRIFLQRCFIAF